MSQFEIGRPQHFDVNRYLDAVEDMINADEVEKAFHMLNNMPAFYVDHVPERALEIRQSLNRQLFTPVQYKGIYDPLSRDEVTKYWPGRAQIVEKLVREMDKPHVMELAPGSFYLPLGLEKRGCQFTYEWQGLDECGPAGDFLLAPRDNAPTLFCCFELIEHLWCEQEVYQNYLKFNREADFVLLSTPLYTCAGGMDNWRARPLGHLRTYSPTSFLAVASQMFQGRKWEAFTDETIILVGKKA
jgi:hypothetical protein